MAKYSRKQRDRVVDLCVKYEHCAADVILYQMTSCT